MGYCTAGNCLKAQADNLIRRSWHYFDRIMVVGPSASKMAHMFDQDADRAVSWLIGYADLIFHLREIGATKFLSFGEKPPPCQEHLSQHASEVGLHHLLDKTPEWVESIRPDAEVKVRFAGIHDCGDGHWDYRIDHPELEHSVWGTVHGKEDEDIAVIVLQALSDLHETLVANLVSDTQYAQFTRASLGVAAPAHEQMITSQVMPISEPGVAFELAFPFVDEADPRELLRFRDSEAEAYDTFHNALRLAIKEAIRNSSDGDDPTSIAITVSEDVIEPSLAQISRKLETSLRSITHSSAVSLGVGALSVIAGLLLSPPLTLGALVPIAGGIVDYRSFLSSRGSIEAADMYFMWKALGRFQAHRSH
jgi:hypothetical protein